MPIIDVAPAGNGTVTYLIHGAPSALPPVLQRDLLAAWDAARAACLASARPGKGRAFRFARPDSGITDLALADTDARCWAAAVDRRTPISTAYGMSVCLRLLALIELLAASPWARRHVSLHEAGAELNPRLVRLAAATTLNDAASFDEAAFRAHMTPPVASANAPRS